MATESELVDLLASIGDHAPTTEHMLDRLALQAPPAVPARRRWLPISGAVAAVIVSVVVSVVVRGGDSDRGAAPPAGMAAPGPTVDRATYPLPLGAYYASATQQRTLQRAQFVLAQRCAQARGVTVPTARFRAGDPRAAFLSTFAGNIRPLTLQQARTIGYDLYPSGTSAVDAAVAGLTPQQREIFQGWSASSRLPKPTDRFLLEGGCYGQAELTLLNGANPTAVAGMRDNDGLPGLFTDDATVRVVYGNGVGSGESSPEVQQAERRWSACMAAHGYPGLHITQDAIQKVGNAGSLQSASAKREAVQDVLCKQSTGFMTVWVASMTKAQNAVIAAHRQTLAEFKKRLATRMANAAKALK